MSEKIPTDQITLTLQNKENIFLYKKKTKTKAQLSRLEPPPPKKKKKKKI